MKKTYQPPKRFIVLDDDPLFVKILANVANQEGVIIDGYASLDNVLNDSEPESYDAAIVDYDLGDQTGVQAVGELQEKLGAMPILLVSQTHRKAMGFERWPKSIQRFVVKSSGYQEILTAAKDLCKAPH